MSARRAAALAAALLALPLAVEAQAVVRNDERLARDRPEAWAMNYVAAPTIMTPFGAAPHLAPGDWRIAADLGHVPRLDEDQQRVGFLGTKQEDLNKSPVFGRLRAQLGLPGGFVAELGYTPPVKIEGARAKDLVAAAIGRTIASRGPFALSARLFGQHGRAQADVTCPARLAGAPPGENPFGCRGPSDDRIALDLFGADATLAWRAGAWEWHGTAGTARTELEVRVDALTFDVRDRSRLTARAWRPWFALGVRRVLTPCWSLAAEVLYLPLSVVREEGAGRERDAFTGLRLQLAYRPR